MSPDETMRELAECMRDAIWDTPDASRLEDSPEDVYHDLACRLILRLARKQLTLTSVVPPADQIETELAKGAKRILGIFTEWLKAHPERHFVTGVDQSGRFEIILRSSGQTCGYFRGESVQDAYGQAAQTISFNGGSLDG